ncbi:hypothetical protein BDV98DRAFT_598119 [Pterulicium gracile]|uniref:Uncharacterized protein n=1 Tax=Pterulicium gracile TaxID=1884261 RepID=A0A5C3Q6S6_9AGAR|nr:hypothetical protein BDV98DRAFT_598119 [Pterula gracilis]
MAAFYVEKPSNACFSTLISVENWLSNGGQPTEAWYKKVRNTLTIFAHITEDKTLLNSITTANKKLAPVEFIACLILISTHKDTMSISQLVWLMAKMQKELRNQFQDIQMNTKVSKVVVTFIKGLKSKTIGGMAGRVSSNQVLNPPQQSLQTAS